MDRDNRGRFIAGNKESSKGGRARAQKLPAHRRKEIARKGWQAMVDRWFNGDEQAAGLWLAKKGQWASDRSQFHSSRPWYMAEDPGPHPAHVTGQGEARKEGE